MTKRRIAVLALFLTTCNAWHAQKKLSSDPRIDAAASTAITARTSETDPPVEKRFHNIQVLSGLPSSQLYPVMAMFANSLGVTCSHCHSEYFEEESKNEKQIARQMIRLTREVNRAQFQGEPTVTCYTCHRGRDFPAAVPDIAQAGWQKMLVPPTPAAPLPEASSVLERYAAAMPVARGGAFERANGEVSAVGGLDERKSGTFTLAPRPTGGVALLSSTQLPPPLEHALSRWRFGAIDVAKAYDDANVLRQTGDAIVITASSNDDPPDLLTFDAKSGLLQRAQSGTSTELGYVPEEIRFGDYRSVDGVPTPFTIEWARGDYLITLHFLEITR